jgi:hypothetical protein
MTIQELMKSENHCDIRISVGDRWLYWEFSNNFWVVRECKRYQKHSRVVIETESEEAAVKALLNG